MNQIESVKPYKASISKDIINQWNGVIRIWSDPQSIVEGSRVVDEIRRPVEVTVIEEQKDMYGSLSQRARIKYGKGKKGWVLYDALKIK